LETQSELTVHSGLQLSYGFPIYSGKQVHDPAPFCSLHSAFTPQGDGTHGLIYSWGIGSAINYINYIIIIIYQIIMIH